MNEQSNQAIPQAQNNLLKTHSIKHPSQTKVTGQKKLPIKTK